MLPLWILIVALALWYFSAEIISNQGRLMFPALSAYAVLWAWGILTLVPPRGSRWTARAAALTFGLIAAVVPLWLIAPSYQPTVVASNQLPKLAQARPARFENGVEWLGARVERDDVRAGDAVAITFYYRVAATPALNQAVFIHFVNSANVIVAQRDSLIGQGNPDALKPNVLYADTLRVAIPHTVPAPDTWRIEAGMYNSDNGARVPVQSDALFTNNSIFLGSLKAQPALTWDYNFGDKVQLVRGDIPQGQVKAGQALPLTLYWRAQNTSDSLNVFLHALGEKDHIWASANTPLDPTKPTRLELHFDPRTPPGVYPLEFGVETEKEGNRLEIFNARGIDLNDRLFLGSVRVTNP
jgi:hypothetical protein